MSDIYVSMLAESLSALETDGIFEAANRSINRIGKHFNDPRSEVVIVSAERHKDGESEQESKERNSRQTAMLKKHLDDNKFSYVPVKGGYIENKGEPDEVATHERGFMVINHPDSPNYRKEGILDHFKKISGHSPISNERGENIEQEAIIHKPAGSTESHMHTISGHNAGESFSVGSFHKDSKSQYFTELKNGKRFELRED